MATLNYKSSSRFFDYKDGDYTLSGQKMSNEEDVMTSVEGGQVQKNDAFIGSFRVSIEGETSKIDIVRMDTSEILVVIPKINALITALAE